MEPKIRSFGPPIAKLWPDIFQYISIYFTKSWLALVGHQLDKKKIFSLMICIGISLAFGVNWSKRRNPLKKMFLSEDVIFWGLRLSLGHFAQQAPESPVSAP